MPYLEEKDLVAMHEQIEKSDKSLKQFESSFYEERKKTDDLKKQRNIFISISSVFLLFLLFGTITYFVNPSGFINDNHLNDCGLELYKSTHVDSLKQKLHEYNERKHELLASNETFKSEAEGILIYAVQVGAFEERMVSMFSETLVNLKEFEEDEFYKYSVGHFDNLSEAQRFRKELLRIGFNDAFVASYENGRRVRIEEAW